MSVLMPACFVVWQVMTAFVEAEQKKRPSPEEMFKDVYDTLPPHLQQKMKEMKEHVLKHKEHYPLERYDKMT